MPFPEIYNDTAVMMKILSGYRPPLSPETSTVGEDYRPGWKLANCCWAHEIEDRPPIVQAIDFLTAGPTAITRTFDAATHADQYLKSVRQSLGWDNYTTFLYRLKAYHEEDQPFYIVYEDMQLILGNRTNLLEGFMLYFPSSKSFHLAFCFWALDLIAGDPETSLDGVPRPVLRRKPKLSLPAREWPVLWRTLQYPRLQSSNNARVDHRDLISEPELPPAVVSSIFRLLEAIDPTPSAKLAIKWLGESASYGSRSMNVGGKNTVESALVRFSSPMTTGDLQRLAGLQITTASHDSGYTP